MLRLATAGETQDTDRIALFGAAAFQQAPRLQLADVPDWRPMQRLSEELEAVGFYLLAHPLDSYAGKLKRLKVTRWADLLASGRSSNVLLAGTVIGRKERTSAKGSKYAFVQLSDTSGVLQSRVFLRYWLPNVAGWRPDPRSCCTSPPRATGMGCAASCRSWSRWSAPSTVSPTASKSASTMTSHFPPSSPRSLRPDRDAARFRLFAWPGGGREAEILLPQPRRITATRPTACAPSPASAMCAEISAVSIRYGFDETRENETRNVRSLGHELIKGIHVARNLFKLLEGAIMTPRRYE